jgi:hypothetical protein
MLFTIELMCDGLGLAVSIEGCRPEEPPIMLIGRLGQRSQHHDRIGKNEGGDRNTENAAAQIEVTTGNKTAAREKPSGE